jgi:protein-L-isoaspartate(D-aspartate) O-methyltransferase
MKNLEKLRDRMIERHLKARGIKDPAVLHAMREVPREAFVPESMATSAYEDAPLPIGQGQTISQPYIVAVMTELLEPSEDDRVLEIGTGSGYAAAVLSRIVVEVYTVERYRDLAETAKARFRRLGYGNIQVLHSDGTLGWPENGPYDAIVVTAGAPEVPQPLKDQLAVGGRLVIPIGSSRTQELMQIRRTAQDTYKEKYLFGVRFVPLVGTAGWKLKADALTPPQDSLR